MNSAELREYLKKHTPIENMWRERFESGDYPVTSTSFDSMIGHYVASWYSTSKTVNVARHSRFFPHYFHAHDFLEIMYLVSGECENISDVGRTTLSPGDLCFVPPGAWHLPLIGQESILINFCARTNWISEKVARINHPSNLTSFLKGLNDQLKPRWMLVKSHSSPEVTDRAERLIAASIEKYEDSEYEIECLLEELLLTTTRLRGDDTETGESFSNDELSSRIISLIGSEYPTLTLDELASRLNYSKAHICRSIRAAFGATFSDIVNQLRISDACHLLKSGGMPVSDIAYSCGFTSVEYFTRTFRRYIGTTPSEYRKSGSESPEPPYKFHVIKL